MKEKYIAAKEGWAANRAGQALPRDHPQTLRIECAKWLNEIIFLDRDILGFWEVRGYPNTADRWSEDRIS